MKMKMRMRMKIKQSHKNFMNNNNVLNSYVLYQIIVYLFGHIFWTIRRIQ